MKEIFELLKQVLNREFIRAVLSNCLLYTSDAADDNTAV